MKKRTLQLYSFTGFYNSEYDADIDSYIESEVDYQINEAWNKKSVSEIEEDISDSIDYKETYNWIAKTYFYMFSEQFKVPLKEIGIEIWEFSELYSPKQYNFSNDAIIYEGDIVDLEKVKSYLLDNKEAFSQYLKDNNTSYSGFMAFNSNDFDTFLIELEDGDSQVSQVVDFYMDNEESFYADINVYEEIVYK